MEARFVNIFLSAFSTTLEQFGVKDIQRTNIKKKSKFYVDMSVSAIVNLSGGIQGSIALSMSEDTAKKLASTMMMGMSVTVIDEIVKSAIGELASVIAGSSLTLLMSSGILMKVSPPIVVLVPMDLNSLEAIAIDFETALGRIEFNIGFI